MRVLTNLMATFAPVALCVPCFTMLYAPLQNPQRFVVAKSGELHTAPAATHFPSTSPTSNVSSNRSVLNTTSSSPP